MTLETGGRDGPTRRDYLGYGGAVLGAGLLCGCAEADESDPESTDSPDGESYAASISPVGEVEFESKPERVFTIMTHHADMALALGYGDDLTALFAPGYNDSLMNAFLERLESVSVDWSGLYGSWNPDKEQVYGLDSDVHLADPANVVGMDAWSLDDVEEIADNVGPWFGNTLSDQHREPSEEFADGYEHYTLWEIFDRVADALAERDRYEALASVRSELLDTISAGLPPEDERPSVGMVLTSTAGDEYWAYEVNEPGFFSAHTRPMGAGDAFADVQQGDGTTHDYETLLDADPDVLLVLGGIVGDRDMPDIRSELESDPVAGEVTAVREGRVHAQGTRHQGPITNLFQLEMTAKQLYPEAFGEWPTYESGPYPEIPEDERLFDRERVAAAIRGDL